MTTDSKTFIRKPISEVLALFPDPKPVLTVAEYRARVDADLASRLRKGQGFRGVHNFASEVIVPGATHAQLVRTEECFSPGCPDHGWA